MNKIRKRHSLKAEAEDIISVMTKINLGGFHNDIVY